MPRKRIDQLLVERGLAESRHKAHALLLAGQVLVDEQKVDKPGRRVPEDASLRILGTLPYASRAGAKLAAALDHFGIEVTGRICADLGASTGGFTDCLLQRGALLVHAYDVGRGQLAWKLQANARVVVHDEFNVRYLTADELPEGVTLVTADLSFISLTLVFGALQEALRPRAGFAPDGRRRADLIFLVKPQFEVDKGEVGKGGIVRDPVLRQRALSRVGDAAVAAGFELAGSIESPVLGAEGNQEFLLCARFIPGLSSPP